MINYSQFSIIKKDFKAIVFNKRLFPTLLIVPLTFTVIVPTIFIMLLHFMPESTDDIQKIVQLIPEVELTGNFQFNIVTFLINYILPIFFILIPVMAASIMAASSFIGEKEKKTLETLLYSPLSLKQILTSKIFASLALSILVCLSSFFVMVVVIQLELMFIMGFNISLNIINWIILLLLVGPSVSLVSITLIVNGSAKSQSVEESQQRAAFLVLPIILLLIGQFTGVVFINAGLLIILAFVFSSIAVFLMRRAAKKFTYELLLK